MGGHSHGEVASRIAVQSIHETVRSHAEEDRGEAEGDGTEVDESSRLLAEAMRQAHQQVLGAIREDGSLYGMGTTVVGFLLTGDTAVVAHVGDSRAYRVRQDRIELLTQDHTWVNEQVVAGFLSEEQARVHPLKNVITRALGGESDVVVDAREIVVEEGELYLLCSDGLTTMLNDIDIHEAVQRQDGLEEACRSLVQAANARGGLDNVTVVLVSVEREDAAETGGSEAWQMSGETEASCDDTRPQ